MVTDREVARGSRAGRVEQAPAPRRFPRLLVALGLLSCLAIGGIGGSRAGGAWAGQFVGAYTAAWLIYLGAALVTARRAPAVRSRRGLQIVVLVALALRMIALLHHPVTSTDIYRYVWDGRQIDAGINPYRYRPDAPQVARLRDATWEAMEFKHIRTLYPPFAELLFAGIARVRSVDTLGFRWAFLLLDMGSVLLIVALLRRTGRDPERVIWYAWNPLVVTEACAGAHMDVMGVFFLLLALAVGARRETETQPGRETETQPGRETETQPGRTQCAPTVVGAALAYVAAVLAKGQAVFAFPFFVRWGGWRLLAVTAVAGALLFVPFRGAGSTIFSGISYYLGYWETNSSLFYLIDWALKVTNPLHLPPLDRGMYPNYIPYTRAITSVLLLLVVGWLAFRQRRGLESLLACTFAALGAHLLLSAPVLPWYVIWTVPALCWWPLPGWVLFTFTVSTGYYLRWILPKPDHALLLWAAYVPVYGLLGWQWWQARKQTGAARAVRTETGG